MLEVLGEAALRSLLLAAVVQCVLWLLRVRQAQLLLVTWTITLMASIAMPVLPQFIPVHLSLSPAFPAPLIEGAADLLLQPYLQAIPGSEAAVESPALFSAWPWLESVYAVVCCSILLRVMLGVGLSFWLLARAVPVWPKWALGQRVRISKDVTGPVTIAHVVLLPASAMTWNAVTQQAVLAHEKAHVARWDFAMLVASQINRALFWFSPLPWLLHRRLVTLSELVSDDQAIASTGDRLGYAEVLLEIGRRSGRTLRGLAMARPSTLLHRIDRILLDQADLRQPSRAQLALLTACMAGLSLAIASLARGPSPEPLKPSSLLPWILQDERSTPLMPSALRQENSLQHTASAPAIVTTIVPSWGAVTGTGSQSRSVPSSLLQTSRAGTAAVQPGRQVTSPARPASRTNTKVTPAPPRSFANGHLPSVVGGDVGLTKDVTAPQGSNVGPSRWATASSNALASPNTPAPDELGSSTSHQAAYEPLSFQSGLEGIGGSSCSGKIAVGLWASGGSLAKPNVLPGQSVSAQAHFFRKDGMLWVRFNAFGRPPLDLPVRFARNGMTWTGEYGIAYTVQAVSRNQLAGLASLVANDSARLDFACFRSTSHLL